MKSLLPGQARRAVLRWWPSRPQSRAGGSPAPALRTMSRGTPLQTPAHFFGHSRAGFIDEARVHINQWFDSFAGISREGGSRTGFAEIADAQIRRLHRLNMAVIKKSVQPSIVARRIMGFAGGNPGERQKRRARRGADARIGTTRCAAMIPGNQPVAGLRAENVAFAGRHAGAVI